CSPSRAYTCGSSLRRSSPYAYGLKSSNSMPSPLLRERRSPTPPLANAPPARSRVRRSLCLSSGGRRLIAGVQARASRDRRSSLSVEQLEEHLLYAETLGSAAVVELEPVAQRWGHREPHVVQTHVESPIEERPRFRSEHDRLSAPRADPEPDVLAHGSRVGRL